VGCHGPECDRFSAGSDSLRHWARYDNFSGLSQCVFPAASLPTVERQRSWRAWPLGGPRCSSVATLRNKQWPDRSDRHVDPGDEQDGLWVCWPSGWRSLVPEFAQNAHSDAEARHFSASVAQPPRSIWSPTFHPPDPGRPHMKVAVRGRRIPPALVSVSVRHRLFHQRARQLICCSAFRYRDCLQLAGSELAPLPSAHIPTELLLEGDGPLPNIAAPSFVPAAPYGGPSGWL
jgi:hypothetical protein